MLIIPRESAFLPIACELPTQLLPWVNCQGPLTEKLRKKTGEARLQVLTQGWRAPNGWDKGVLHCNSEAVLQREVVMWALDAPCWYARTIIPYTTYSAHKSLFNRLENESLGALIFSVPEIKRVDMVHYPIDKHCIEYYWLNPSMLSEANVLWVRLSTLSITDRLAFFLVEILLPGLTRYLN